MLEQLFQYFSESTWMKWLEITAVVTALIYVFLAAKEKALCFLFGFISSAIYIYICFKFKLYFDTLISIYYTIMSVVGWILWNKPKKAEKNKITFIGKNKLIVLGLIGFIIVGISGTLANHFSDASLPYLDSFTTTFAVIATFMVVKKQIENWILLAVVDAVSISMYFHKDLYFTSFLYFVYTIIAIKGFLIWKNKYNMQNNP